MVTYWKALLWVTGFFPFRVLSSLSHSFHVYNIFNIESMCRALVWNRPYRFLYVFSTITKNVMVPLLFCIVGMCLRVVCAWWNVTLGSSEGQEF